MKSKIEKLEIEERKVSHRLQRIYSLRLSVVIGGFLLLLLSVSFKWQMVSFLAVVFLIALFLWLIRLTDRNRQFWQNLKNYRSFLLRQTERQQGIYRNPAMSRTGSALDLDFDLYGPRSLFSQISECFTDIGQKKLSFRLENPQLDVEKLLSIQSQIHKLSRFRWPLMKTAILGASKDGILPLNSLKTQFTSEFLTHRQKSRVKAIILIWFLALGMLLAGAWNMSFGFFFIFWVGSIYVLGELKGLFFKGIEMELQLEKLEHIFQHLEKAQPLAAIIPDILSQKPSKVFKKLRTNLSFLSVQGNPLVALIVNMASPWNLFFSYRLEKTRESISKNLPSYLENLSDLEFYLSLTTMYLYQSQTFSDYVAKPYLEAEGLFHPLIPRSHVVKNNFHFSDGETLGFITGSNMSGKSTFLRAVGINHLLAMMGAPVFADHFVTFPSHLQSCIRVSDSVDDGYSYFYAEVRRLKFILEEIRSGKPTFFIVDEIFKGTNNKERVEGGRAILDSFLSDHSMGFVTTHDMELALKPPAGVANWHFSDSYENGQIYFSYKISEGPSTTTNALKIMELEGLFKDQKPRLRPV